MCDCEGIYAAFKQRKPLPLLFEDQLLLICTFYFRNVKIIILFISEMACLCQVVDVSKSSSWSAGFKGLNEGFICWLLWGRFTECLYRNIKSWGVGSVCVYVRKMFRG